MHGESCSVKLVEYLSNNIHYVLDVFVLWHRKMLQFYFVFCFITHDESSQPDVFTAAFCQHASLAMVRFAFTMRGFW